MPKIPQLISTVRPESTPQPGLSIESAMQPGDAAARLGQSISQVGNVVDDFAQKQIQLQRLTQYTKRVTDAKLKVDTFTRAQEDNPNLDFSDQNQSAAYEKSISAGLDQIQQETLKGVRDPQLSAMLQEELLKTRGTAIIDARDFARKQTIQAGRGELDRANDTDLKLAVNAQGPALDAIIAGVPARLMAAQHANLISPVQRQQMGQEWFDKLEAVRIDKQIQTNPDAALAELKSGGLPDGMLQQGNIDVNHRPVINNADGSHSTIFSATIPINKDGSPWEGKYEDAPAYALVPQIAGGKFLTSDGKMPDRNNADQMNALEDAAIEHYAKTGEHLGIFSSGQAADNFAEKTHAYMPNGKGDQVFLPPGAGNPSVAAMDPEQRQKLIDQATNQKIKLQAEARKAADDARETAVATMDSQARAKTLTHNDLEDARTKFNLKPAEYDKLYDLIDQKPHESPSDTTIHDAMAVAIQLDPSSVTQEQLHKYYLDATAGKPGLNLTDFAKLDNLRKEGLKAENAPDSAISKLQTVAMGNLEIRLHLSPQILEAARTQLVKSPGFKTDPVGTANKIIDSNKDAIEALGGHTPTAIETRFESAQKAFLQIQKDQQEWDRIHYLTSSEKNPNNVLIIQRKQDFLDAAKAAGKDRGPAPKDKPEGKAFVGEDGRAYIVINGRTIPL